MTPQMGKVSIGTYVWVINLVREPSALNGCQICSQLTNPPESNSLFQGKAVPGEGMNHSNRIDTATTPSHGWAMKSQLSMIQS